MATSLGGALLEGSCPVPQVGYDRVVLGHGSGGRLSQELLRQVFLPAWGSSVAHQEDQAVFEVPPGRLAMTTDAFVVSPLRFPGGNIGDLAVNGTVNDLAVGGAIPLQLSVAFVLEEGLPLEVLRQVVDSMARAAQAAQVKICTGDTKVVERGKADGLFVTTTGIGIVPDTRHLSATMAQAGDRILVSGNLGDHGMAIMCQREGIRLSSDIISDTAPLLEVVETLLAAAPGTRCMRDATRGGVSSALNEIASSSDVGMELSEPAIPVHPSTRAACEILGLDPLYVANEGKFVAIVPESQAEDALAAVRMHPLGKRAALIGRVTGDHPGRVTIRSAYGAHRFLPLLSGEQLPRIC